MKFDRKEIATRLRSMAQSGQVRPLQQKTIEGRFLSLMTCPTSTYYDGQLDADIRALRPDWFRKPRHDVAATKERIFEHARAGLPRSGLSKRDNNALNHYLYEERGSHDGEFKTEIVKLRPDWFNDSRVNQRKEDLRAAAQRGDDLDGVAVMVTRFTRQSSPQFDAAFAAELRQARPEWFWNDTDRLKDEILQLARSGADQPSPGRDRRIYHAFRRYTRASEKAYDAAYAEQLRQVRPDWFAGRANRKRIIDPTPS